MDHEDARYELLRGNDGIDELAYMDKIYIYLEQIDQEDEDFIELLVEKCKDAKIYWHQPWYQTIGGLTRPFHEDNNQQEKYRTDKISKKENEKIKKNWSKFIKEFDVPDKLISLARWKNKEKSRKPNTPKELARRCAVAYLARGLERTLYQVFKHIMTYFGGPNKGHYSPEEEKLMKICFEQNPGEAVIMLSKVLNREPRGIYKRLSQVYTGKPVKKRVIWTLPLATKFLKLLMKNTGLSLEELKNREFDKAVWLKLEKKFDHHYIHLDEFWKASLHVQLFVKENVTLKQIRTRIFEKLKQFKYQVWSDIRWKELAKHFPDGYTPRFLNRASRRVIVPRSFLKTKSLRELIDYGLDRVKTIQYSRRRLRTLTLNKNGELEEIRYSKQTTNGY